MSIYFNPFLGIYQVVEPNVVIDVEAVEVTDEETDNNQTDNKE